MVIIIIIISFLKCFNDHMADIYDFLSVFCQRKAKKIEQILSKDPVDIAELRQQSISRGGLLTDDLRRRAWPILLNVNVKNITPKPG